MASNKFSSKRKKMYYNYSIVLDFMFMKSNSDRMPTTTAKNLS